MGYPVHQSSTAKACHWLSASPGTGHSPPRAAQWDHAGHVSQGHTLGVFNNTAGISQIAEAEKALDFCPSPGRWSKGGQTLMPENPGT